MIIKKKWKLIKKIDSLIMFYQEIELGDKYGHFPGLHKLS